ncbi:DUF2617 family protein [Knoellia flava]|uniref:DUF2617 family protein n=1 Tax=Knoellia flava TaxID=913969 RepID=UPI000A4AA983|nr:DUF2617 family protein [Knoellia flava]
MPYADTRAEDLRWSLDHGELPAVVTAGVDALVDGCPVELRILGASHQVVLEAPGLPRLVETVAYVPGLGDPLPRSGVHTTGGDAPWSYELTSEVEVLAPDDLRDRVASLVADLDGRPDALSAAFPGDRHAVTAVHAEPLPGGGATWRTWHAYPQHGQLVSTRTLVRPAPLAPAVPSARPTDPQPPLEEPACDAR